VGFTAVLLALAPVLGAFVGAAALALPPSFAPLAVFLALGAIFLWLAAFLAGAFSGAMCAPCAATVAAFVGGVGFCGRHLCVVPFLRLFGAHD
jgi:hypothetical protein